MKLIRYLAGFPIKQQGPDIDIGSVDIYSMPADKYKQFNKGYVSKNIMHSLKFQYLFNHRWFYYLHISKLDPVDLAPYFDSMCDAYDRMGLKINFDNLFLLPVNSPAYQSLSQIHKDTFSHNLLSFYDLIYYSVTHYKNNQLDFISIFERCTREINRIKIYS